MIRTRHLVLAALLHLALGLVLVLRWPSPKVRQAQPAVIQAVVIDPAREALAREKAREQAEQERLRAAEEARRKAEQARRQAEEEARRRAAEQARKAAEEARRKAEAEARRKAEEEARRKAAEEARRKAEEEARRKAAEEARRKAEEEARRKAAEEARRKAEEEARRRELMEAIAREQREREAAERAAQLASERELWIALIADAVQRNWIKPQGLPDRDFTCIVAVEQLPGGQIIKVQVVQSCGNPLLDRSVEAAVRKSDPLPIPPNPAVFEREIQFIFKPR